MFDRRKELIACCESIIRNVDNITNDWGHNVAFEVIIRFPCNKLPEVEIKKTIAPKELIKVLDEE